MSASNNFPKLHNAAWPGVVGKGGEGAEPFIGLDEMLDLTAAAEVNGVKFDGIDLFLSDPHVSINASGDDLKRLADKVLARGLVIGSVVAPVWAPTGGGSAMGSARERGKYLTQVKKACRIAKKLRELRVRPYGIVRVDTAVGPQVLLLQDHDICRQQTVATLQEACNIAEGLGERLAAEGEICWALLHSWREAEALLHEVNRPKALGFQADMAHTLLYLLGYNAPSDRLLPDGWKWDSPAVLDQNYRFMTAKLRPWTIDFHVAQNDATVKGSGTHDKTGRHCLPNDPNGKLDITKHAGYWLRDKKGRLTKACRHICWDGCMFGNDVMRKSETWNEILSTMIAVRDAHGWVE